MTIHTLPELKLCGKSLGVHRKKKPSFLGRFPEFKRKEADKEYQKVGQ
jgi:hypothetical protein